MEALTIHALELPGEKGGTITHPPGVIVDIEDGLFEDLKSRGAVRAPHKARDPLDHDNDGRRGGSAPPLDPTALVAKHKGAGRWMVVDADENVVSGDDLFESKDAADAWITMQAGG